MSNTTNQISPKKVNTEAIIKELHRAFKLFNSHLFNNQLPEPAILIQSKGNKKLCLGWCTVDKVWINTETQEERYEINLVAEYLNRGLLPVMSTLLHEMVHLHNLVNDIKDVSRGGTYHNKRFKEVAESHGLNVSHNDKIGWSVSELQDSTVKMVYKAKLSESVFAVGRKDFDGDEDKPKKKKSNVKKYVCPACGQIIRATKTVNVVCGICLDTTGEIIRFECDDPEDADIEDIETPVETIETDGEEEITEEEVVETPQAPQTPPIEYVEKTQEELDQEVIDNIAAQLRKMDERAKSLGIGECTPTKLPINLSDKMSAWAKYSEGKWFGFSKQYLTSYPTSNIIDTINHLYVHHLEYELFGKKNNHGKHFKDLCIKLGVDPQPCTDTISHRPNR